MNFDCTHLDEVRHALRSGYWPAAASPELRDHVAACTRCGQEVLLTTHLQQARSEALSATPPASPSLVWWRAQARRRQAALARASRPVLAAQVFAIVVVVATVALLAARHWQSMLDNALAAPASIGGMLDVWGIAPLVLGALLLSALAAVIVYLTAERP
jgi:hypothetical protein